MTPTTLNLTWTERAALLRLYDRLDLMWKDEPARWSELDALKRVLAALTFERSERTHD